MERPNPTKRKPLRNVVSEEITDNIKNDAALKYAQRDLSSSTNNSDENSTFDEENDNKNLGTRQSPRKKVTKKSDALPRKRSRSSNRNTSTDNHSNVNKSFESKEKLYPNSRVHKDQQKTESHLSKIWGIIFLIIAIILFLNFLPSSFKNDIFGQSLKMNSNDGLDDAKTTLWALQSKYKNQNKDLWLSAYSGIRQLIELKSKKPSIIVLLGKNSDPVDCLAVLLGNVSSNALNTGTLKLTPEKFDQNVGTVIESLRKKIEDKKVVIIWDLLNVNTEALKAFHNLCDTYNPLVDEVIIIMTIIANNYDESMKPLEFVEKELLKKLSGKVKDDAIQPLITRITDGAVFHVKPEPTLTDCPLPKVSN